MITFLHLAKGVTVSGQWSNHKERFSKTKSLRFVSKVVSPTLAVFNNWVVFQSNVLPRRSRNFQGKNMYSLPYSRGIKRSTLLEYSRNFYLVFFTSTTILNTKESSLKFKTSYWRYCWITSQAPRTDPHQR